MQLDNSSSPARLFHQLLDLRSEFQVLVRTSSYLLEELIQSVQGSVRLILLGTSGSILSGPSRGECIVLFLRLSLPQLLHEESALLKDILAFIILSMVVGKHPWSLIFYPLRENSTFFILSKFEL
ncbi:MAG: hypothetical protein EZS28_014524 [Streblomastix strix]|uniref:Uncharacterized protein n=1 Tax=Streblomastix strix TaxID=222440 RepID=A0A5J4W5N1_9EUKA|nr:MAG: hypothetical protein EZS28_014524 [Streblomastix strix]